MSVSESTRVEFEPLTVDMKECCSATRHIGYNLAVGLGGMIMCAGLGAWVLFGSLSFLGAWGLFGFLLGMAGWMFALSYGFFWWTFRSGQDIAKLHIDDEGITVTKTSGKQVSVRWDVPALVIYLIDYTKLDPRTRERYGFVKYPFRVGVRKAGGLATLIPEVAFQRLMESVRTKGFQVFSKPGQGPLSKGIIYVARGPKPR